MQTLSQTEEQKLIDGIKTAVDLVDNKGMSPTDALIKVAKDSEFTPGGVRAAVSAFNNGRQVAQFRANDNALDKLAEFPLADYDKVHDAIWGGEAEKQAEDLSMFDQGWFIQSRSQHSLLNSDLGGLIKAAAEIEVDGDVEIEIETGEETEEEKKEASDRRARKAYHGYLDSRRSMEESRTKYAHAQDVLNTRVRILKNYFKKMAMDRMPFSVVEDAVGAYWGQAGRTLMDHVHEAVPHEKRAADTRIYWSKGIDLESPPFTFVGACVDAAQNVNLTKKAYDEKQAELKQAEETLRPFVRQTPQSKPPPLTCDLFSGTPPIEKQAIGGMIGGAAVATGTREMLQKALGKEGRKELVEDEWLKLEDPDHENELRKIRVQAMLSKMMADSSNPISGYDPEEVLGAFNDISQMSPRVAEQPAALQPILAKRLAGQVEPFEVKEVADTEKALKESLQITPSSNLLQNAPSSILG